MRRQNYEGIVVYIWQTKILNKLLYLLVFGKLCFE
jgi:hypothetical protein